MVLAVDAAHDLAVPPVVDGDGLDLVAGTAVHHVLAHDPYYDDAGELFKVRTFDEVETIGGHPTPLRLRMDTVKLGTSSTITLSRVTYEDVP